MKLDRIIDINIHIRVAEHVRLLFSGQSDNSFIGDQLYRAIPPDIPFGTAHLTSDLGRWYSDVGGQTVLAATVDSGCDYPRPNHVTTLAIKTMLITISDTGKNALASLPA